MTTDSSIEVFTNRWAERFRDEINRSEAYREHGANWDQPVALEMSFRGGAQPRGVVLDLHRGTCRHARCQATNEAALVIRADVSGWRKLLAGQLDPIWAIMSGRLKLIRGDLHDLIPFARAAKALVDAAAGLDADFPPEAGP